MPIITCEGWSVCDADVSRMVWNKKKGRKEEEEEEEEEEEGEVRFLVA
jgi:hypothetical protein